MSTELSWKRVAVLGFCLLGIGTLSFRFLPGLLSESATGSPWVNAFYCSVITLTTVGFGEVCPGKLDPAGRMLLVMYVLGCLGFFCGPVLELAASWRRKIPGGGGRLALTSAVLAVGVAIFSWDGLSLVEAAYASVITAATIGYGDSTPKSDAGKVLVALYALLVVNAMAILLQPGRDFLERLCRPPPEIAKPTKKSE